MYSVGYVTFDNVDCVYTIDNTLKAAGLITRVGSSRNGYWEIRSEPEE